jgi:hypothetical protein
MSLNSRGLAQRLPIAGRVLGDRILPKLRKKRQNKENYPAEGRN